MYMAETVIQVSKMARVATTTCRPMKVSSWMETIEAMEEYLMVFTNSLARAGSTRRIT